MSHTVPTWPVNLIFMGDDHWSDLDTATWSLKKIIIFLTSWLGGSNVSIQFNSKNFSNSEGKCSIISRLYLIFCGSETRNTSHFFSFLKKNPTNLCLIFNLTLNTKHCQKSMLLSKCRPYQSWSETYRGQHHVTLLLLNNNHTWVLQQTLFNRKISRSIIKLLL